MKRTVFALVVLSLIAVLIAGCSPDVGTGDSGNDNTPPVEENPEVDLPSGAPELAGTFEEYCNLAAPDMDENTVAGWLMYMVCAIGQQEAHEDPIGTTTEKTYIIDGDSIPEAGASYWGSFTMDITENKMSASGRLSLMDRFVFDISGYMTEVDGIIEINGQEYSFLTPSLGID